MEVKGMDPSLYEAAASGNIDFLKNIRDGDILFQKTPKNNNVLHIAAQFKQTVFFKEFPTQDIRSVPLFWATNNKGDTPMHVAARVGCVTLVKFLIDHAKKLHNIEAAADVETGPADAEAYKELLRMTNLKKDTALHVAVECGNYRSMTLLVNADPELCSFTNNANESPLFLAISKGFPNIASYILDKSPASLSFVGINGVTALHAAVTRNLTCKDIVKIMVSKNPEMIREVDELGWTPLHYAAFRGNVEATRSLIGRDSSAAYILDKSGMSALHVAAYAGRIEVMKELIQLRPDTCDLLNHKGQTVVHAAVLGEKATVINYILKTPELAGLVNEADNDGNTPLHQAAFKQNTIIMKALARDPKVDKTATNNCHSKAADIFVGDDPKVGFSGLRILRLLGTSVGVPFFQRHVRRDFTELESSEEITELESPEEITELESPEEITELESPEEKKVASTTVPIPNNESAKALLDDSEKLDTNPLAKRAGPIRYSIVAIAVAFCSAMFSVLPKYISSGILVILLCCILVILLCSAYVFIRRLGVFLPTARQIRTRNWLRTRII